MHSCGRLSCEARSFVESSVGQTTLQVEASWQREAAVAAPPRRHHAPRPPAPVTRKVIAASTDTTRASIH